MSTQVIDHDQIVNLNDDDTIQYEESDESRAFREFKTSFDDEAMGTLRVHRVPESTSIRNKGAIKSIYLFSCTIDKFDFDSLLEFLRDRYGGGTYRLIGSRAGKQGVAFNRLVEIEAPKTGFMGSLDSDPLKGNNVNDPAAVMSQFGSILLEHQRTTEEMLRGNPLVQTDPFDQMTKMMTAMGTMMQAMGLQQQAPQSVGSQIKEFLQIKELLEGMSGGDQGEANLYSLLGETVRAFGPALGAAFTSAQQAGTVSEAGLLENPAEPKETPEERAQRNYMESLKTQLKILVANAESGVDPEKFAEMVIANTTEEQQDRLYEFLEREDYEAQLIELNPEVETHKNWFRKWRDTILDLLTVPDDESISGESETVAGDDQEPVESDTPDGDVSENS